MQITSPPLLVEDRVDGDGRLAGLAIADDQLALAAADRGHRVDGLDAGLQRLLDGLTIGDAWGDRLDGPPFGGHDRPFAVERIAQRVDHAADEGLPHGNRQLTFANFPKQLEAIAIGQTYVEQQQIERLLSELGKAGFTGFRAGNTVAFARKQELEAFADF